MRRDRHDFTLEQAVRMLSLAPARNSVLSYHLRDANGTVTFADNSPGQPAVLRQLDG